MDKPIAGHQPVQTNCSKITGVGKQTDKGNLKRTLSVLFY